MKVPILNLQRQYADFKEELEPRILETLQSGNYVMGKEVSTLEEELCEYIGCKNAITVGNGTDALVIALEACGVKEGDEVITTPFTFFATAESIASVGATPVFVDVDYENLNIDVTKIEEKITSKTKAILPVHIFGRMANMDEIMRIAKKYNLKVIEDACQAIGAEYKNIKAGALGDIACFSFFPTKNLGAFGDAGLITTNDEQLSVICKALREHAGGKNGLQAKNILEGNVEALKELKEEDPLYNPYKYYNYLIAYNSRLDSIQAVVLRTKLKHLDKWNAKRTQNAKFYLENLKGVGDIVLQQELTDRKDVWHQFVIKTKYKDELGKFLSDNGVGTGAFYPIPLHLQEAFKYLGYKEGSLPVSERLSKETVCLPIFPELTQEELQYIVDMIKKFFEKM
ncbi:MAG: DegT/DnrJ/EryC1/StrS family aminotransferase [Clostridia bacterium]|nr:DegT/DnrJ/EryC1/StrS family aminotransferase [Clostridia bacterium]